KGADTYYYRAIWSPDSKKLLWADRLQRLRYVDVASKAITQVDQDKYGEIRGYDWSPDSQWIPWCRPEENEGEKVYLFSTADKKPVTVTDDWYSASNPAFSDDGKYLLLTSSRDFKPILGQTDFSNVYRDMDRVYLITLAKETESPLAPRSDEVGKARKKKEKDKEADEQKPEDKKAESKDAQEKKQAPVKVDTDGIHNRLV